MLKVFKSEKTAKAAVKNNGIEGIPHTFEPHCSAAGTGWIVRFTVDNSEDFHELVKRGFSAKIQREEK